MGVLYSRPRDVRLDSKMEGTRFGRRRCVRAGGERGRGRRGVEQGRSRTRARDFRRASCGARVGVRVERAAGAPSSDKEKPTTLSAKNDSAVTDRESL